MAIVEEETRKCIWNKLRKVSLYKKLIYTKLRSAVMCIAHRAGFVTELHTYFCGNEALFLPA